MRKIRKRVFAAVLAAVMLFTMPGMASVAVEEDVQPKDISESVMVLAEDDAAEETESETEVIQESETEDSDTGQPETGEGDTVDTGTDAREPVEEETVHRQKEDTEECICGTLCAEDSINGDCHVCGVEGTDLTRCKGEKTENSSEENKEDAEQGDTGAQDAGTNLCTHHKEHTKDCGYSPASEDGEGSKCTYECRICPIEDLIAALPSRVTEDNRAEVEAQLQEMLYLYRELTEDEQGQIDLSLCQELQEQLDEANAPVPIDDPTEGTVAQVETSDGTIAYLSESDFINVFDDRKYNNVTVTLLSDIQPGSIDMGGVQARVHIFNTCTLDLAGHTITDSDTAIYVWPTSNLTIRDSSFGKNGQVVSTGGAAILTQTGMVSLIGGTYTGNPAIDGKNSSTNVSFLLANYGTQATPHYAYFDTQGNPIALKENQRELTSSVMVKECTHQGNLQDNEDGTHGGDCPYCGTEFSAAPHTLGVGNKCEGCGAALKVQAEISGTTTYYDTIDAAWAAANLKTAIITLLDDATATTYLEVNSGSDITFNGGNCTLTGSPGNSVIEVSGGKLTINSGTLKAVANSIKMNQASVYVGSGTLVITGGTLEGADGVTNGIGLYVDHNTVHISGGKFIGGTSGYCGGIYVDSTIGLSIGDLLLNYGTATEPHYAFFDANNNPVSLTDSPKELPGGPYTVQECKHTGVSSSPKNDGTHILKCPYCGYTGTPENCSYGTEYKHDDINHTQTCMVCGYEKAEAHNWEFVWNQTGNVTEDFWECRDCRRTKNHFTVTITVPAGLTYGNTGGKKVTYMVSSETTCDKVIWELQNDGSWTGLADGVLPAVLSVGDHLIRVDGYMSDNTLVFTGFANVAVAPAPLTGDMVTLSPESVTYSGAAQKPTITVKQGETTLAEGADYDIIYSTTDFTNAGTVIITITGKGNYTGTVEKTYTIKKTPLTITAGDQTITYGESIAQGADNVTAAGLCSGDRLDGITLTASTANIPGGNITPSAAGIKNSGGRDVTGNYEITYKDGGLTINKADAEIMVGTDTYNKTFGDAVFTIDVTDNNTEADVQYEVTAGADVISVSNGTVTIQNAGAATITVSLPETANYNAAASRTITVSVAQKGGYTVAEMNRSYLYSRENTGSIDLAALLPKDCGTVTYGTPAASGDVTYSAAPAVNNGILSYTLNSGNKNDEGTITVTVSTRNYTDITITVKVKLTDQLPVSLKTGTEVTLINNILTYGEPLSELVFNKAEFVGDDGKPVEGTLAWKDAAATPNAGSTGAVWVFTPADKAYMSVEGMAAIRVNQATPTVSETPALTNRVYDPSIPLKDDDLSSVTVTGVDGKALEGKWSWKSANIVPTVDNSGYNAVFTPEDTTNYETVTRTITVNVTKATPYITGLPAAAAIIYGETLKDSLLSGGIVQYGSGTGQAGDKDGSSETVAGAFTWKEPSTKPVVADSNVTGYTIVFTPSDTADYNPVEAKVKLTVNKAQNAPNMPGSAMSVSNSIEKVGSVPLPAGWEWQASDRDTALEAGVAVSAVAVYTGADKGNYENETVTVAITGSNCDHVAGDILYTGEDERAPTCTEDGLGHKECTVCGAVMGSGIVVEALKHTGGTATCSRRAICTRCNQPYGDTDSNMHGGTEVRGFAAATCTAGGYTGDIYCKDCGAKIKAGNTTPALGHDYTGRVTKEPTTESEGIRTYTCTRCGNQYTESMPRLPEETHGHSYTGSITKEPTCTDTGVRTYTCTCGDSYTETIAALGHHYLGSETRKPITAAEGVMTYTCDRCGHSYTRPIAKLPGDDTAKPGSSQPGIPFIKGEDGKNGWEVIRAEEEQAKEGSVINVDMNGTTVVPGDIFDCIRGRDITITFDMGGGIIWSVDGKSVTTDRAGDIDFDLRTGVNAIPADIVNNVTGENYSIQISLAHEGEFGFTAMLSINLGKENAGNTASLYYYNQSTGGLEFICADEVAEDGTASIAFTHASDYVIAIDGDEEEGSGGVIEDARPQGTDGNGTAVPESPETMQEKKNVIGPIVAGIIALAGIAFAAVFAWKKKEENESVKEDK